METGVKWEMLAKMQEAGDKSTSAYQANTEHQTSVSSAFLSPGLALAYSAALLGKVLET